MNNFIIPSLIVIAAALSACGDEAVSCSNPTITNKVIDLARSSMNGQANQTLNVMLAMVAKGKMDLQNVRTDTKSDTVTICAADLHVIVDPNFVKETQGAVKAEPMIPVTYSVQETDDKKSFYIKILKLDW